jgi:HTH-like domain
MRRHHSQVRSSSWTRFFDGVTYHQNHIGRSLPNAVYRQPVSIPQGAQERRDQFFRRSAHQGGIAERKAMIDREHDLSITKQAEVLKISRGSVYYLPRPVSSADLAIMRQLDRLHLEFPFAGSRMLRGLLAAQGCKIGRRHVKTLIRRMGIEALYRRPRTTKPEPGHKIYPYLLRGMERSRVRTRSGPWTSPTVRLAPRNRGGICLECNEKGGV